jgi:signal transduction histidine kinase
MLFDVDSRRRSLRHRLLFWVWLVSSLTTFTFTTIQLYTDYHQEENLALDQIDNIKKNFVPSINKSLWDYNTNYLELQLISLRNLSHVKHVEVVSDDFVSKEKNPDHGDLSIFVIPLVYNNEAIGELEIGLDIVGIQKSYLIKSLYIFLYQALKTLIVCFLLLNIFEKIIMKHVVKISKYLKEFELNDGKKLDLDRSGSINDELSMLTNSINNLKNELSTTRATLLELNSDLENKVKERTALLEEERARSIQSAKLASLGEMAGGIAHEINNPLAIISSTMQFLRKSVQKKKLTDEIIIDAIDTIDATVVRTSKIITGLRTVSHHSDTFSKRDIVARHIFDDVLGLCSERFKNHGVEILLNLEGEEFDGLISCDRVQLSQVLINLLGNAFDAIQGLENKWIKLELLRDNDFDLIRVSDSGTGIPEEIIEKIFNPFFTSKDVGKGTGLGLSISKSIMAKHNGSIELDQTSEHTCFVIRIPVPAT